MFSRILCASLLTAALSFPLAAQAEQTFSHPTGLWLTENERSVIKVTECGDSLCGHVHWVIEGGMEHDSKNPDESKRNDPMCGLKVLWDFHQQGQYSWADGKIYKADEGDTYSATLQMLPTGNMKVRGYLGMPLLGKSQTWRPVTEAEYPACTS